MDVSSRCTLCVTELLSVRSVLDFVNYVSGFVFHVLDYLFHLVFCVAKLLFGLTSLTISLSFGFKVLVADQTSDCLFGLALNLLGLTCHGASPFLVMRRIATPKPAWNALPPMA